MMHSCSVYNVEIGRKAGLQSRNLSRILIFKTYHEEALDVMRPEVHAYYRLEFV
jgi:hypothetical protein